MPGNKGLTEKQKRFAVLRASGETLADSFKGAGYGPGTSHKNARLNGRKVQAVPAVAAEIKRLQGLAEQKMILSQEQRGVLLSEVAVDKEQNTSDRIRAVDVLNKMSGVYSGMAVGVVVNLDDKRAAVLAALGEYENES